MLSGACLWTFSFKIFASNPFTIGFEDFGVDRRGSLRQSCYRIQFLWNGKSTILFYGTGERAMSRGISFWRRISQTRKRPLFQFGQHLHSFWGQFSANHSLCLHSCSLDTSSILSCICFTNVCFSCNHTHFIYEKKNDFLSNFWSESKNDYFLQRV